MDDYVNIKGEKITIRSLTDKQVVLTYKFFNSLLRKILQKRGQQTSILQNNAESNHIQNMISIRDRLRDEIKSRRLKMISFQNGNMPDKV